MGEGIERGKAKPGDAFKTLLREARAEEAQGDLFFHMMQVKLSEELHVDATSADLIPCVNSSVVIKLGEGGLSIVHGTCQVGVIGDGDNTALQEAVRQSGGMVSASVTRIGTIDKESFFVKVSTDGRGSNAA